jgi:hypothetical protein
MQSESWRFEYGGGAAARSPASSGRLARSRPQASVKCANRIEELPMIVPLIIFTGARDSRRRASERM